MNKIALLYTGLFASAVIIVSALGWREMKNQPQEETKPVEIQYIVDNDKKVCFAKLELVEGNPTTHVVWIPCNFPEEVKK